MRLAQYIAEAEQVVCKDFVLGAVVPVVEIGRATTSVVVEVKLAAKPVVGASPMCFYLPATSSLAQLVLLGRPHIILWIAKLNLFLIPFY